MEEILHDERGEHRDGESLQSGQRNHRSGLTSSLQRLQIDGGRAQRAEQLGLEQLVDGLHFLLVERVAPRAHGENERGIQRKRMIYGEENGETGNSGPAGARNARRCACAARDSGRSRPAAPHSHGETGEFGARRP